MTQVFLSHFLGHKRRSGEQIADAMASTSRTFPKLRRPDAPSFRALNPKVFALHSPICSQLFRSASHCCGGSCVWCVLESSMSAVFGRRRRLIRVWAGTIIFAATLGAPAAQADSVTVNVDQALVMKLPERVATIVIGNPLIADAALQNGGVLVITGKGYGSTNLLALDRSGRVVMDKTVQVLGASGGDLVVVYKGVERETYNCAPDCERRITLGDSQGYFNAALSESGARTGQAQAGSQPH